jgi:hypothetical protein
VQQVWLKRLPPNLLLAVSAAPIARSSESVQCHVVRELPGRPADGLVPALATAPHGAPPHSTQLICSEHVARVPTGPCTSRSHRRSGEGDSTPPRVPGNSWNRRDCPWLAAGVGVQSPFVAIVYSARRGPVQARQCHITAVGNSIISTDMFETRAHGQRPAVSPAEPSKRLVRTRVVAELKCFLCGRPAGLVESCQDAPASRVLVRIPGQGVTTLVEDWRRLRCRACGARLYLDDVRTVIERIEPPSDKLWAAERPRVRKLAGGEPEIQAN